MWLSNLLLNRWTLQRKGAKRTLSWLGSREARKLKIEPGLSDSIDKWFLVCKSLKRASFECLGCLPLGVVGKGPCQVVEGVGGGPEGEGPIERS